MNYEFTYELSDELLRRSTKRYARHVFGRRVPVTVALMLVLLVPLCAFDDGDFLCGVFVGALLLLAVLVGIALLTRDRKTLQFARKLETRSARCTIRDESITLENALATSMLKWPLFDKVVRGPDVWLFLMSRQQYFALPAEKLTAEARALIERKVAQVR